MKAVYLKEPKNIYIEEIAKPEYKAGEGMALIKIKSMGICGSDIGAYRGVNPIVSYPRIIGHELAGIIEEIDENNPKGLKKGDRVALEPFLYCGDCYPCSLGRTNCCETLKTLGVHTDGGMTEYFLHPDHLLVPVPENVPWEIAPLVEPLAISMHGIHRAKVSEGQHVVINGCGAIGLLAALGCLAYKAIPIVIDPVAERLEYAKSLGVPYTICPVEEDSIARIREITNGRMAEVVLEMSGAGSAIRQSLDMVSHAGKIVLTGWPKSETTLPTNLITTKEIDVIGGRNSAKEFDECYDLIASGRVNAKAILSKVISIDEVPAAVEELSEFPGRYMKICAVVE